MKTYALFNYNYIFGDHMAKASLEARFLYIKMNFYATNGFVPNVLQIIDSLNLNKGHLQELIDLGEVLTIPEREEVFITAFFLHNKGANPCTWLNTPYGIYWKGKLWVKKNGIATLKPQQETYESDDPLEELERIGGYN